MNTTGDSMINAEEQAIRALELMWDFASRMVEKHGMDGDDTMTDEEHQLWQRAAGKAFTLDIRRPK